MVAPAVAPAPMSEPLEDYLETIYLLVQEHGFARVRDIASARNVKAATVSIALRKLAEAGLVDYVRREYIGLTETGGRAARRVLTRHRLLTRFFEEVLGMSPAAASDQACSMEHALTDEAMDRLVRFFEFLGACPSVVRAFGQCPMGAPPAEEQPCGAASPDCARCALSRVEPSPSLTSLAPGQQGVVAHVTATGETRQRILDMGILPGTTVVVDRVSPDGRQLRVLCQGAELSLDRDEASAVLLRRPA